MDGTPLSSSWRYIHLNTGNDEEDCSTDAAWPVAKGPHTVRFRATDLESTTVFDEATLQVLFVPFNGSGQVPQPVAPAAPAAPNPGSNDPA